MATGIFTNFFPPNDPFAPQGGGSNPFPRPSLQSPAAAEGSAVIYAPPSDLKTFGSSSYGPSLGGAAVSSGDGLFASAISGGGLVSAGGSGETKIGGGASNAEGPSLLAQPADGEAAQQKAPAQNSSTVAPNSTDLIGNEEAGKSYVQQLIAEQLDPSTSSIKDQRKSNNSIPAGSDKNAKSIAVDSLSVPGLVHSNSPAKGKGPSVVEEPTPKEPTGEGTPIPVPPGTPEAPEEPPPTPPEEPEETEKERREREKLAAKEAKEKARADAKAAQQEAQRRKEAEDRKDDGNTRDNGPNNGNSGGTLGIMAALRGANGNGHQADGSTSLKVGQAGLSIAQGLNGGEDLPTAREGDYTDRLQDRSTLTFGGSSAGSAPAESAQPPTGRSGGVSSSKDSDAQSARENASASTEVKTVQTVSDFIQGPTLSLRELNAGSDQTTDPAVVSAQQAPEPTTGAVDTKAVAPQVSPEQPTQPGVSANPNQPPAPGDRKDRKQNPPAVETKADHQKGQPRRADADLNNPPAAGEVPGGPPKEQPLHILPVAEDPKNTPRQNRKAKESPAQPDNKGNGNGKQKDDKDLAQILPVGEDRKPLDPPAKKKDSSAKPPNNEASIQPFPDKKSKPPEDRERVDNDKKEARPTPVKKSKETKEDGESDRSSTDKTEKETRSTETKKSKSSALNRITDLVKSLSSKHSSPSNDKLSSIGDAVRISFSGAVGATKGSTAFSTTTRTDAAGKTSISIGPNKSSAGGGVFGSATAGGNTGFLGLGSSSSQPAGKSEGVGLGQQTQPVPIVRVAAKIEAPRSPEVPENRANKIDEKA